MIIRCLFDKLVKIDDLKLDPDNRNEHPESQIKQLAAILKYQGWRYCVKVSNQSGYVRSGYGRILAARMNGWDEVPVSFQDYDSPEQEYADSIADNAIALQSELDLAGIQMDVGNLSTDFNVEFLGIENFKLNSEPEPLPEIEEPKKQFIVACYLPNELEMQDLYDDLISKGIECKLIT